jgi:hypothetical protein
VPSVVRDHRPAAGVPPSGDDLRQLRERALVVLLDASLEPVVELVAWAQPPWVHVATARGAARVRLDHPGGPYEVLHGVDPLAGQDPLALVPPAAEQGTPRPRGAAQHYPHAAVRLASLFSAGGRSPDIAVVHTDAHHWPERGGHLGEHGSLGVLQSRAPFLLSGVGVGPRGVLADSARTVDVMPTLARLAGVTAAPLDGLEGRARLDLVTPLDPPAYVVGLLWDGANAQDLYDLATRGELPAVARLLDRGCALAGGAVAEFPSVTLVNHASALTGVGPGRHGIVHNVFYDRDRGEQLIANDAGTWHQACDLLRPGVTTLWEEVARARPEAMTVCVNEPVDRGAGYSTFGMVRARGGADGARGLGGELPGAEEDPHATAAAVAASPDYRWSTQVDRLGLQQVLALWGDGVPPALTWWNTTLTDTGHHEGGPRSEVARASLRDSDRRLGAWLDVLERRGLTDRVVVLLTADHGMAAADPACSGDWDDALRSAGVPFRDEGYGFLYLGV